MPRNPKQTHIDAVLKAKARVKGVDRMRKDANDAANKAVAKAVQAGVSNNELARQWGTSVARIRERRIAGENLIEKGGR
jgi:hypothetical protein